MAETLVTKGRFEAGMVGKVIEESVDIYTRMALYKVEFFKKKKSLGFDFYTSNEIKML